MYLPPNTIQSLSETIVDRAVTAALTELKINNKLRQTRMEQPRINGKVNFTPKEIELKKYMINGTDTIEKDYHLNMQKIGQPGMNGISVSNDGHTNLQTIPEDGTESELQTEQNVGTKTLQTIQVDDNSSDDSSSVTSESDSSDSSEPQIITFKADGTPKSPEPKEENMFHSNNKAKTNGEFSEEVFPSQGFPSNTDQQHSAVLVHSFNNSTQLNPDGIKNGTQLNPEPLPSNHLPEVKNGLSEGNSSGSSDVVFGNRSGKNGVNDLHNSEDSINKKDLNNSGNVSGGSDSKDRNEMLAELQKIVQEDQLNQGNEKETSVPPSSTLAVSQNSVQLPSEKDGAINNSKNTANKDKVSNTSYQENSVTISNHSTGNPETSQVNGSISWHGDASSSHRNSYHVNGDSYNDSNSDLKGDNTQNQRDSNTSLSNPQQNTDGESYTLKTKESFENIEKKLVQLETSNTEQTSEIQRLKSVNESLKTKFKHLEETSGQHHKLEGQMLKKNEELEKHLLSVLKSQEMIFDMREKMAAVTKANEKLTKDYQDAVKALEAVDKVFGQKDKLVQKWKNATEESRRLVELLKKHNAEIADLEMVDKLKEEMAMLQKKNLKEEETNKEHSRRNEELGEQSKAWRKKFEFENEQRIKLNYELQEVKKEARNQHKLAGKRGRKNQMLQLEMTELKDILKIAKEKAVNNDMRMKELELKNSSAQEMYTKIIHEKEKQHSVLLKNLETQQKDSIAKDQLAGTLRQEIDSLKTKIHGIENEKMETEEKLTKSHKSLETSLGKQDEFKTDLQKMQSELEQSKIEKVDNDLYIEEQSVQLKELGEQCRDLQDVVKQFIFKTTQRPKRQRSHGRLPMSRSMPTYPNLDMYKRILAPPKTMRSRPHSSSEKLQPINYEVKNVENNNEVGQPSFTSTIDNSRSLSARPKSTYGNRQLSLSNKAEHDQSEQNKEWLPKVVLVDSKKLEASSDSGSGVSADQFAMEYVKVGDRVLIEIPIEGRNQNLPGVVKYIGPVYHRNFKMGIYAGLRLDIPVGDTNGTLGGRVYFQCLNHHGKFIHLSHILAIQNKRTQQYTRIFPLTK